MELLPDGLQTMPLIEGDLIEEISRRIKFTDTEELLLKHIVGCIEKVQDKGDKITLRLAGGLVRDKLLCIDSDDIDIAIDTMTGKEFADIFKDYLESQGISTGNVGIVERNPDQSKHLETAILSFCDQKIDFVNLRTEVYNEIHNAEIIQASESDDTFTTSQDSLYTKKNRIPKSIQFGSEKEDSYRRDITINSLYFNINTMKIEDWTGKGIIDLMLGRIRTPLSPENILLDDPLRILRILRFSSRFLYQVQNDIFISILKFKYLKLALREKVSKERVFMELEKMLFIDSKRNLEFKPIIDINSENDKEYETLIRKADEDIQHHNQYMHIHSTDSSIHLPNALYTKSETHFGVKTKDSLELSESNPFVGKIPCIQNFANRMDLIPEIDFTECGFINRAECSQFLIYYLDLYDVLFMPDEFSDDSHLSLHSNEDLHNYSIRKERRSTTFAYTKLYYEVFTRFIKYDFLREMKFREITFPLTNKNNFILFMMINLLGFRNKKINATRINQKRMKQVHLVEFVCRFQLKMKHAYIKLFSGLSDKVDLFVDLLCSSEYEKMSLKDMCHLLLKIGDNWEYTLALSLVICFCDFVIHQNTKNQILSLYKCSLSSIIPPEKPFIDWVKMKNALYLLEDKYIDHQNYCILKERTTTFLDAVNTNNLRSLFTTSHVVNGKEIIKALDIKKPQDMPTLCIELTVWQVLNKKNERDENTKREALEYLKNVYTPVGCKEK